MFALNFFLDVIHSTLFGTKPPFIARFDGSDWQELKQRFYERCRVVRTKELDELLQVLLTWLTAICQLLMVGCVTFKALASFAWVADPYSSSRASRSDADMWFGMDCRWLMPKLTNGEAVRVERNFRPTVTIVPLSSSETDNRYQFEQFSPFFRRTPLSKPPHQMVIWLFFHSHMLRKDIFRLTGWIEAPMRRHPSD